MRHVLAFDAAERDFAHCRKGARAGRAFVSRGARVNVCMT
jgi:hypothetical protein